MILPISVVIPTFNEAKYLPMLLRSIEEQIDRPAEILVADAKSTDITKEIAKKFGCTITVGGIIPVGRNNGAVKSSQKILYFLDADTQLPSHFFKNTYREFQRKNLDLASCFVKPDSNKLLDKISCNILNHYYKYTNSIRPHTYGNCIITTKHCYKVVNGFDTSITVGEDQDYVLRAKEAGMKHDMLSSATVTMSMRRFEKEGRLSLLWKYSLVELQLMRYGKVIKGHIPYTYGEY